MTVHLQLAEAGKQRMLDGDYAGALQRLRTALHIALEQRAPAVFLHHYTDCILDCCTTAGAHEQALELTERALEDQDPQGETLGEAIRRSLIERRILLLFSLGRTDDGDDALADVPELDTPVLRALREDRRRRLRVDARRIEELRRRYAPSSVSDRHLRSTDAAQGETIFQKEFIHG